MTADEIIEYYVQTSHSTLLTTKQHPLCPYILKSWTCLNVDGQAVIHGQIHNHPQYPSGKPLKTLPIEGYCSDNGHVYVCTNNSMYELGLPHQRFEGDPQWLLS